MSAGVIRELFVGQAEQAQLSPFMWTLVEDVGIITQRVFLNNEHLLKLYAAKSNTTFTSVEQFEYFNRNGLSYRREYYLRWNQDRKDRIYNAPLMVIQAMAAFHSKHIDVMMFSDLTR